MKRILGLAFAGAALAQGVSVPAGEPGFYGQIAGRPQPDWGENKLPLNQH